MKNKSYMTISEFSRITGIKRANLIFYDNIGLLAPEFRGENDYRYYTRQQLGTAYLITSLRDLALSLDEIRSYAKERTPENLFKLLAEQENRIQKEIIRLRGMKDMMRLYADMAQEGISADTKQVFLRQQKKEPIFLGKKTDPSKSDDENSILFYREIASNTIASGYPLGAVITKRAFDMPAKLSPVQDPAANLVEHYYFRIKHGANAFKPEGLYAVTYGACGYGKSDFLYDRLAQYIKEQGLSICSDAYEEYLLNEMAIQDDDGYLTKVEVMVE